MPNRNYLKGVRKERKIVNEARERGLISFRSAGSHSPIDVCIIDKLARVIRFVQCKPDDFSSSKTFDLLLEQQDLNGKFDVSFEVV